MWKCVSSRLATTILMNVPAYQSRRQEAIRFTLERSFVPNLIQYRALAVNDMMEDIILIEGTIIDYNTTEHYVAPTYISRTVQKIMLLRSDPDLQQKRVEPKLLIIPVQDVEPFEIMELGAQTSEMVRLEKITSFWFIWSVLEVNTFIERCATDTATQILNEKT